MSSLRNDQEAIRDAPLRPLDLAVRTLVYLMPKWPAQLDDEDDPVVLPPSSQPPLASPPEPQRHPQERMLAWIMLFLGVTGVLLGCIMPGTATEVILGAILITLGFRVLFVRGDREASR